MKKTLWSWLSALSLVLALSTTSMATLITKDLSNPGDGLLTYDSTTGLSWLNVASTVGHSYNAIISGYNGFTTTLGFRYATVNDVSQLFTDAGLVGGTNNDSQYYNAATSLINLLGITRNTGLMIGAWGITGTILPDLPGFHDIGAVNVDINGFDYVYPNISAINDTNSLTFVGSFLIRDTPSSIPEPSTALLIGAGVAMLVVFKKKLSTRS